MTEETKETGVVPIAETQVGQTSRDETQRDESPQLQERNNSPASNFEALRESKQRIERERDELRAKLKERDSGVDTSREDIKELKQNWVNQRNEVESNRIESQLRETYPDLDSVINNKNIEELKKKDKNFAKMIDSSSNNPNDLYHRAVAAYSLIKKHGIYVEDNYADDRARVSDNMSKPRPASSASTRTSEGLADFAAFSDMNTEERRKAIFKLARERANG